MAHEMLTFFVPMASRLQYVARSHGSEELGLALTSWHQQHKICAYKKFLLIFLSKRLYYTALQVLAE